MTPEEQVDAAAINAHIQSFLQEHAASLKKILCAYVLRMDLARGENVRLVADEAFQDAMLEVMAHGERFMGMAQPRSWFLAVVERKLDSQTSYQAFIAYWNGADWQKTTFPYPPLHSSSDGRSSQYLSKLVAVSTSDAWAIGGQFGNYDQTPEHVLLEHWNGRSWQSVPWTQKYNGSLSVLLEIDGRVWTAGTIYSGFQQIPSQIVETTC